MVGISARAMGNLEGIIFAMIFRFQPSPAGKAFWISGIIAIVSRRTYPYVMWSEYWLLYDPGREFIAFCDLCT